MQPPREVPAAATSRRSVLRLLGLAGLTAAGAAGLGACSAADREALLSVDPRRVRLDEGVVPRPEEPGPSERELRRRRVRAGSLAAAAALAGADDDASPLLGRTGGTTDRTAAAEVHRVHAEVLAGSPSPGPRAPSPLLPGPVPDDGGPTLAPGDRAAAVLRTGWSSAQDACRAELAEADAQPGLALLHAWVAAARAAQATGLVGVAAAPLVWPTAAAGRAVVDALQGLLAQEHRARWSYAVVAAWSTDRAADAEAARADHTRRVEQLVDLLGLLGADPVPALATYPTDEGGRPVDGPVTAAALALRTEDAVTAAAAEVLAAAVGEAGDEDDAPGGAGSWVRAAVRGLAEAERTRWSWGGTPVPWPGAAGPPG